MNRLTHWQLFAIFFTPIFISLHLDSEFYKGLAKSVSFAFIIIYYLSIGQYLNDFKIKNEQILFQFNCIYLLLLVMLSNAAELMGKHQLIIGVISFYGLIAFLQVVDHLAILLRMREDKPVNNHKQKLEMLLFFVWPIGVWFIQPRINNIR